MPTPKNSTPQSLQLTNDDKFYSRLLSKETSAAAPSFRVYYGNASGAVPFVWESQPGTPKASVTTDTIPPLTPPPSYQSNPRDSKRTSGKKPSKPSSLLRHCCCLLPKLTVRNKGLSSSPSSSSSSASSSGSSTGSHGRSRSLQSSFDFNESGDEGSPRSMLTTSRRMRGCWTWGV